ncbi:hypothetical protein V7056_08090, partial [Bacillus sp. JJ664]
MVVNNENINDQWKDMTDKEKIDYYNNIKIMHPKMIKVMKELKTQIKNPPGNNMIMVIGPSGVGKSTL